MLRSSKRGGIGLLALLLGVAVPVGLLALVFNAMDPDRLSASWSLGITEAEVDRYANLLDLRNGSGSNAEPERYLLTTLAEGDCITDPGGAGWNAYWFEAEGHGDSVRVRRLRTMDGGFVIKFDREEPFRAQRHVVLIPADPGSIRAKYLEVLAGELGLVTPEVSFVRLIACGKDHGIYLKEERIDADFLEKHRLAGASLFEQGSRAGRPDHLFPAFDDDTLAGPMVVRTLALAYADVEQGRMDGLPYLIDRNAAAGRLLMHWIEEGNAAFENEDLFAYQWSSGRIIPLYRRARERAEDTDRSTAPVLLNFMTAMTKDPEFRTLLQKRHLELVDQLWRLKERFAAMDRAWLPILARGGSLALAQARAQRTQERLIGARLESGDPLGSLDRQLVQNAGYMTFAEGIPSGQRYWPTADDDAILQRIATKHKARVASDSILFSRGKYTISEDLTIPYGRTVVLEQGARLELAEGVSVVVQGPLVVRGTRRNPVFVRPQRDEAPFGTFAVVGDGSTKCVITGLQLSGGSEARVNGVYFSGMFAIHGAASTSMADCVIGGSTGEDGMNIKGGTVVIRDCVFEDGFADLVDLDNCTGSVSGCSFRSGKKDSNGDGLDVSGARILVEDCVFQRMMDKGISVGEASQLFVRRSKFEGNKLALAAKDLSIAYVQDNVFTANTTVFGAYRKKPIYGGARVMRYANEYIDNAQDQQVDALSAVVPQDHMEPKVLAIFGLE